jgi:hypothetical protein
MMNGRLNLASDATVESIASNNTTVGGMDMTHLIRKELVAFGFAALLAAGAGVWQGSAQAATLAEVQAKARAERHPVIQQSIRQLEGVKDRLQKAPTDFGGHRAAAVEAITRAIGELHQAEAFDKK